MDNQTITRLIRAIQKGSTQLTIDGHECYLSPISKGTTVVTLSAQNNTVARNIAAEASDKFAIAPSYMFPGTLPAGIENVEVLGILLVGGLIEMGDVTDVDEIYSRLNITYNMGASAPVDMQAVDRHEIAFHSIPDTYSGANSANPYFAPVFLPFEDPGKVVYTKNVTKSYLNISAHYEARRDGNAAISVAGQTFTYELTPQLVITPISGLGDKIAPFLR